MMLFFFSFRISLFNVLSFEDKKNLGCHFQCPFSFCPVLLLNFVEFIFFFFHNEIRHRFKDPIGNKRARNWREEMFYTRCDIEMLTVNVYSSESFFLWNCTCFMQKMFVKKKKEETKFAKKNHLGTFDIKLFDKIVIQSTLCKKCNLRPTEGWTIRQSMKYNKPI